tara:strand:- start:793 stop:1233 length:441 start_codon:yes stop_codon:yes gene_type:complete
MQYKKLYFIITFIIIPIYLFFTPLKDYIENFNKITYSLEIPEKKIAEDSKSISEYDIFSLDNEFLLEKRVSESWVLIFPDLNNDELKNNFIDELKVLGIKSIVDLKFNDKTIFGIGPFVDKKMAEIIAAKVNKSTGEKSIIKRLNN